MYMARTRYNANKRDEILYNFEEYAFPIDSFEYSLFKGTNKQREGLVSLRLDKTTNDLNVNKYNLNIKT